jgi:hypothetical protein
MIVSFEKFNIQTMKPYLYPYVKKFSSFSHFSPRLILFLLFFSSLFTARATNLTVTAPTCSVTSMGSLVAGDTIFITGGTYTTMVFGGLSNVTIINKGSQVVFAGSNYCDFGNSGPSMSNITFTGTGVNGLFYGFKFTNSNVGILNTAQHNQQIRMYNIDFEGVPQNCIDLSGYSATYNGTTGTMKMYQMTIANCLLNNSERLWQGTYGSASQLQGICDSICIHDIIVTQTSGNGTQIAGPMTRMNIYNWKMTFVGTPTVFGDVGAFQIAGNGQVHHIYKRGGRGYTVRILLYSLGSSVGEFYFYDVIDIASNAYGLIDIRSDHNFWTEPNNYFTRANGHVLNNTSGNKTDVNNYVCPLAVVGQMDGGSTCEVRNNLGFNNQYGANTCINNNSNATWLTVNSDTSNNYYLPASQILNVLADTVNCFIKAGSPIIDKGHTEPFVTTDFAGVPRPQGAAYDVGAREYSSSASFVTANAGANQTITLPTNSVSLSASGSSVVNSTISSYAWSEVSGPNAATLSAATSVNTSASGLVAGVYVFSVKVKDANNDSSTATVTITVNASVPPIVSAGANQTITLPTNSVTLTGTATDILGISSYLWTQVSGPNTPTIVAANAISTSVTGLIAGTYVFQLKVIDPLNLSAVATVTINVNPANQPPVANAGASQTITLPVNSASLSGTLSTDPSGTIVSYGWTEISGPSTATISGANTATPSVSSLIAGTYVFQLLVTDNNGLTGTAQVKIIVNAAVNIPPVSNAGNNQTITLPVNAAALDGSASKDPDGIIVSFKWTQISGPSAATIVTANNVTTLVNNLVQGVYTFRLTVTDNGGATGTDSLLVTVNPAINQLPVANAGTSKTITLPVNSVSLDGSLSYDPDGTIASYSWTEVSGPSTATITGAGTVTPTVSSLVQGQYVFQLAVTDNGGATSTAQVNVIVNPAASVNPTANPGANQTITLPVDSVNVDGSASVAPSGTIVNFSWTQISGPSTANIVNPANVSTLIKNLVQGTYVFGLTVKDNNGNTGTGSVTIIVNSALNIPPVANAGTSVTIILPLDSVTLNGTKSSDPDGAIVSYSWVQVSGPSTATISNLNSATPTVTGLIAGIYNFQLTVTDNSGASNSATVKITVTAQANQPPVANAGVNQTITLPANTANLDGSASYDPSGTITSFSWTKSSGTGAVTITNSNTAKPTVTGLQQGQYVFQLTVADNVGASASAQVTVTVDPASVSNQPPVANAGKDTTIALPASSIILNGSASAAPSGIITNYQWVQVSGPNSPVIGSVDSVVTSVNGLTTGTYVFQLTVTDNHGASSTDSVTVTVVNNLRTSLVQIITIYPNPTASTLNLQITSPVNGDLQVRIYDIRGRLVMERDYTKTSNYFSIPINVSRLYGGTYVLRAEIARKTVLIAPFVKQ